MRLFLPLVFGMAVVVHAAGLCRAPFQGRDRTRPPCLSILDYLSFGDFSISCRPGTISGTSPTCWSTRCSQPGSLPLLRRLADGPAAGFFAWLDDGSAWLLLLVPALPFLVYRLTLDPYFPTTHTLWGDWANIAHTLTMFLFGFMAARSDAFWSAVAKTLPVAIVLALSPGRRAVGGAAELAAGGC